MKNFKKFLAAVSFGIFFAGGNVSAQIVTDKVPLLTFADASVQAYESPNGAKKGIIPASSSLVLVKEIRADGWAYGSYQPTGKPKRIYRWFKMSELQGYANFKNYTDKVAYDTEVYRTRTSTNLNGRVPGNEDFIVVAERGDKRKIIYQGDGDRFRMGWISKTSQANTDEFPAPDYGLENGETSETETLPSEENFETESEPELQYEE